MKKVLVTGANGFIGHHLARELRKQGCFVIAVAKGPSRYKDAFDEYWNTNLVENYYYKQFINGVDEIYHMAAWIGGIKFLKDNEATVMHDNTLMDLYIIEEAVKQGIKKIFYPSSACVYPNTKTNELNVRPINENDALPALPTVGYGWEKIYMEQVYEYYRKQFGIDTKIARFFSVYGPEAKFRGDDTKVLIALCRKVAEAKNGEEIEIWGDGLNTRCLCYVDDVVDGVIKLMNSEHHGPINIGSDQPISVNCMVDVIEKVANKKLKRKYIMENERGVRGRNCDCLAARHLLNWTQKVSFKEGVRRTYKWLEQQIALGF